MKKFEYEVFQKYQGGEWSWEVFQVTERNRRLCVERGEAMTRWGAKMAAERYIKHRLNPPKPFDQRRERFTYPPRKKV